MSRKPTIKECVLVKTLSIEEYGHCHSPECHNPRAYAYDPEKRRRYVSSCCMEHMPKVGVKVSAKEQEAKRS